MNRSDSLRSVIVGLGDGNVSRAALDGFFRV